MSRKLAVGAVPMTELPCPRCRALAEDGGLRVEAVQRLPEGAFAPLARDGSGRCCLDCASADGLLRLGSSLTFEMARVAVGNDRQEQYRLPGVRMGLVAQGFVRPSEVGDFEAHVRWLDRHGWFGVDPREAG